MDDWQLIESYAREKSELAFQALVERHAGLVYASALRQVHDPHLAEDVAQAVFILMARKAGRLRPGTVVSGWLFQTTRFVAARAVRSEQRRQRREQEAFHMQQLTSTDEAWERMRPIIDQVLARLARPDRDAILLRYVQGRSMREVSASLGVTEAAAKKRIARAVEKLRQALEGNGAVLPAAAITSALAAHASAAAPATLLSALSSDALVTGGTSGGVAAMVNDTLAAWQWLKLKWLAGAGASAVTAVAILLTTMNHPGSRLDERMEIEPLLAQAASSADAGSAGDPRVPGVPAQQGDPGLKHLRLRVVGADSGEAVAEARLFLSVWRPGGIENHWNLATDAGGVCDVAYAPDAGRIDIGVMRDGWAARYATWPSEGLSGVPAEYELKLARVTNSIGGTVCDPAGRPLADAVIWFQGRESGDSAHRLRPRERFGFVWSVPAARTDPRGRWSLAFIPPTHRGFELEARHPDYTDTCLVISPEQQSLEDIESAELKQLWAGQLISTMNVAFTLVGAVTDERAVPIAGAKVRRRDQGDVFTADASGQFQVPKLKAGYWPFTVTAEGFAPVRTNALVGPGMQPVIVMLRTGAVLRLRVVDETGFAVPDAEVCLEQWGENRHDMAWLGRTDFDGRIEWVSAPRDVDLELFARKEGFCYTRDVRLKADGNEHTIAIHSTLDVYGRVVDTESGRAVRDFKAMPGYGGYDRFHDSELRWYGGETVRGTNGTFKLRFTENVRPWRVRLTADGYEDWISEPLTNNRIQVVLDIGMKRAKPTDSVRGVVLLPGGAPAVGALVALLTFEHNVRLRKQAFEGDPRWLAKAGEQGEFSFPVNRLAHSVAAANDAGYAHLRVRDAREPVTLQLEPWGRVQGTVEESAARLGVVRVQLYDPAADNYQGRVSLLSSYSAEPDGDRRFVFEHVPAGEFSVFVNSMNNIPYHHQTPLVVRPGETTHVVIRERPGTRVTGQFVPPAGRTLDWKKDFVCSQLYADLPQASALIDPGPPEERPIRELDFWTSSAGREHINTPRVYSAVVRDDGGFASLENLPPGKYRFTTVFKGCSATEQVTVGEEQPEELPLGEIQLR